MIEWDEKRRFKMNVCDYFIFTQGNLSNQFKQKIER